MAKPCNCGLHQTAKAKTVISNVLGASHYERHGRDWCADIERFSQRRDNYGAVLPTGLLFIEIGGRHG